MQFGGQSCSPDPHSAITLIAETAVTSGSEMQGAAWTQGRALIYIKIILNHSQRAKSSLNGFCVGVNYMGTKDQTMPAAHIESDTLMQNLKLP